MEKKARYHEPEIEVIYFGLEDIIRTSPGGASSSGSPAGSSGSSSSQTFNLF